MSARTPLRAAGLALLLSSSACAYFNGVYNSREAERKADRQLAQGEEPIQEFRAVAEKAETVLARYPKSRWRADALYLAGRGHAYAGDCPEAEPRLSEFLATGRGRADDRARATVALASCDVRDGHFSAARAALAPLGTYRQRRIATEASLWSARAALALNDGDGARRDLARVGTSAAAWELFAASMERGEIARAESLLVVRAADGDYRDDVLGALRELWRGGRGESAERIVALYAASRARSSDKARLEIAASDLAFAARRDSGAVRHLTTARRFTTDPPTLREISARELALKVARARTTAEAEAAIRTDSAAARGAPLVARLADNTLLVRLFEKFRDVSGAAEFLAGEVARDSLAATSLAHALFLGVVRDAAPNSAMPARALLAAATLIPDSAPAYRARVLDRYPNTPTAKILRGIDPKDDPAFARSDDELRETWERVLTTLTDSLARRHPADSTAKATAPGATPPSTAAARPTGVTPP